MYYTRIYNQTMQQHFKMHLINMTSILNILFFFIDDHSRIILKASASDGSGYINANYIEASIYKRT